MSTQPIFLGGLPRSGSTLLTSMLSQHPDITTSGTSGLAALVATCREAYTKREEFSANDETEMNRRMTNALIGLVNGWSISPTKYYVDKGRGWLPMTTLLRELVGTPKIIVPIRDLRGIFTSMEKLYRSNTLPIDPVILNSDINGVTLDDRFNTWASTLPIGPCIGQLKDVLDKKLANSMLFIRMEDLTKYPQSVLDEICNAFELPRFTLELPITNPSKENDRLYGIPNLHNIEENLVSQCSEDWNEVLGEAISNQIFSGYSWFYEAFYPELIK